MKFILDKLTKIIKNQLQNYCNENIQEDYQMLSQAENENDFNVVNVFNVIIEEKRVIYI